MSVKKEIDCAVKRIAALHKNSMPKMTIEQERIIAYVEESYEKGSFNFDKAEFITIKRNGKKRLVRQYGDLYSPENILCHAIKQILDRVFKVSYPNRNKISRDLFSILPATIQMSDFTIVKFDLKNYFNSVSSIYVFEKYLKDALRDRHEADLIKTFVYSTKYAYAGLCTSNTIAEIIAGYFDKAVCQTFSKNGIIYYERYVDDSILILNEHMEEKEVKIILNEILSNVFHDDNLKCLKCKTQFNNQKFQYISRRKILKGNCSTDFLGYEFTFFKKQNKSKTEIKINYGITQEKQKKYNERLDKLIFLYTDVKSPDFQNLELLRHRIAAFSSRVVYISKHFSSNVWCVKGFISNYGELRPLLGTELIEESTEEFLKNAVTNAFNRAGIKMPYFMTGGGYDLYSNMEANKTLLLVDQIGYDYKALVDLCKQIKISDRDINNKRRGYGTLVRDYLIKVRVGY